MMRWLPFRYSNALSTDHVDCARIEGTSAIRPSPESSQRSGIEGWLPLNRPCSSTLSRVSVLGRPYFFKEPGGNCLSNFSTPLFRFWMFLLELLEIVSLELPLHTSCFVFVSNRSTTNVPTLYVSVVVVASPKPPPPKPLQPQPPPDPS